MLFAFITINAWFPLFSVLSFVCGIVTQDNSHVMFWKLIFYRLIVTYPFILLFVFVEVQLTPCSCTLCSWHLDCAHSLHR